MGIIVKMSHSFVCYVIFQRPDITDVDEHPDIILPLRCEKYFNVLYIILYEWWASHYNQ